MAWCRHASLSSLRPEWVFLALALCFGIALLVLTVPFEAPDEPTHFFRAVQISEGRLIALKQGGETGDVLPGSLPSLVDRFQAIRVQPKTTAAEILDTAAVHADPDDRRFVPFSNTAVFPPLPYLPQALGIFIARHVSSSVLAWLYAARLSNLLAATALMFWAVRRTPVAQWAFVVLALLPMALFETAVVSCDAVTNALAFLLIAQVLACAFREEGLVPLRSLLFLALLAAALGLSKQAYFLLPLCYLLIPRAKLGTRRRYWIGFAAVMASALVTAAFWSAVVHQIYSPAQPGNDPAAQWQAMCSEPGAFLLGLLRTVTLFAPSHLWQFVGVLGWLDTPLPIWLVVAECLLLFLVLLADFDPGRRLTTWQSVWALAVAAVVGLTVLVVVHLIGDQVGDTSRLVVQGRYFIPIGPLVAVGLSGLGRLTARGQPKLRSVLPAAVTTCIACFLAATVATIHHRYFVDDPDTFAQRWTADGIKLATLGRFDEAIAHYETALATKPDYAIARFDLASALGARGRLDEAIAHYQRALQLSPNDAKGHNNLANALCRTGRFEEAIPHAERALALDSSFAEAHYNLGAALAACGRLDEAIAHAQKAVAIKPTYAEAHYNLGVALREQGRLADAVAHWRETVRLRPTQIMALNELAWTLATCHEPSLRSSAEAVTLAERAVELSRGQEPTILGTLAAAYAAAGRFSEAAATAQRAVNVAVAQNKTALAETLQSRLKLYQAGMAFHE